ncbi:MAG: hypothetical protein J1F71_07020, partial [Clostridiales bacterium]|nr:hypothetical protein [Clostridiales bacterium]
ELAAEYKRLMSRSGYRYSLEYVMGEYVTMAYRKTAEYSYYVYAMGNVDGAQELAARIIAK